MIGYRVRVPGNQSKQNPAQTGGNCEQKVWHHKYQLWYYYIQTLTDGRSSKRYTAADLLLIAKSCRTIACNGAGGRVGFDVNTSRAGPLMRVDYEVLGLQVVFATIFWFPVLYMIKFPVGAFVGELRGSDTSFRCTSYSVKDG